MIPNQPQLAAGPPAAVRATTAKAHQGNIEPDLQAWLAMLPTRNAGELKQIWRQLTGRPAPKLGSMLLRHALAWEMQAQVYGGLSPRTKRRLVQSANGSAQRQARAGLTLVREWKGVLHTVTLDHNEVVHWNGKTWNSLSEVARAITGTRWSGPLFFGLKQKPSEA